MIVEQILINITKKNKLPFLDIELILAYVLNKSREYILAHPEQILTAEQISNFKFQISKRKKGEPMAYLTGEKEFYGLNFKVNKYTLIPRPETELMVDEAVKLLKIAPSPSQGEGRGEVVGGHTLNSKPHPNPLLVKERGNLIIDVGTGSGCIIISLAKLLINQKLIMLATDISKKALTVAKQNAKLNKVDKKIKFLHGNLLEPILKILDSCLRRNDDDENKKLIILANLPYLTPTQIKNSPSIKHEPKLALTAGIDGLKYYCQLFKQIKKLLDMRFVMRDACYVLCEIDPSQKNTIKKLIKKELPEAKMEIKKDLRGHSRLVIIKL